MTHSILIVEDEPDIARLLAMNLEAEGYECSVSYRGDEALTVALEQRPDLVLLDLMLPGLDGVEVCRRLRDDPRTTGAGIIMLTARTLPSDRVAGLQAGADDYVDKPFDPDELMARVQSWLRRAGQLRSTSPLTGLPGNFEIEQRIALSLGREEGFALLHADLDGFKAYNDRYGFVQGDVAIVRTARVIEQAVAEVGGSAFVGHIGGDDFAILCDPAEAEGLAMAIVDRFAAMVPSLYESEDAARGSIEVEDRAGRRHRHPLLSISVGIASSEIRTFTTTAQVAAVATELKGLAKAAGGSAWRADRRRA